MLRSVDTQELNFARTVRIARPYPEHEQQATLPHDKKQSCITCHSNTPSSKIFERALPPVRVHESRLEPILSRQLLPAMRRNNGKSHQLDQMQHVDSTLRISRIALISVCWKNSLKAECRHQVTALSPTAHSCRKVRVCSKAE